MNEENTYELTFLDPAKVTLFRTGGSAVRATVDDSALGPARTYLQVQIARAFPLSLPDEYIGLRDAKDKDIGMLVHLKGLDNASRAILDEEMERRYFLPRVTRVLKAKKEFDTVTWEVETDKGPRTYVVQNLRESAAEIQPHRVVVTDRTGSRFEFLDVRDAGAETIAILARVLN